MLGAASKRSAAADTNLVQKAKDRHAALELLVALLFCALYRGGGEEGEGARGDDIVEDLEDGHLHHQRGRGVLVGCRRGRLVGCRRAATP